MAQVVSSIWESKSGKYTVTIKPNLINSKLSLRENSVKNLSRYTVPNNIVNIIKNTVFAPFEIIPEKKYTQLEQIQLFVLFNICENVPQVCDNYKSSLPSYVYVNLLDDPSMDSDLKEFGRNSTLGKIYAIERNIDYDGFSLLNIPKDYTFTINPCPTGFKCVPSWIVVYIISLILTMISLSVLSSILTVNMNQKGFNALTVILLVLLLFSLSICIINIYQIYTLRADFDQFLTMA